MAICDPVAPVRALHERYMERVATFEEGAAEMETSQTQDSPVVVLSKSDLLETLQGIRKMLEEYRQLIERMTDSEDWNREALELVRHHHSLYQNGDSPLARLHLVTGLFQYMLKRVNQEEFQFLLPTRTGLLPESENKELAEFSKQLRLINAATENLVADVMALANSSPVNGQQKLRGLLLSTVSFLKGLIRQDWEDVALFMTHINLITTSWESRQLVGQIAKIARSIYDSLNEFSEGFSMESLSHSAGELPDAVMKLNSVISRLEEAANTNLDTLENLTGQLQEHSQWLTESQQVIDECDGDLEQLKSENPELAGELESIQAVLREEIRGDLKLLEGRAEEDNGTYLAMMSNQSFQDLTGQTLEKVIKFIESLQFKLIALLPNYRAYKEEGKAEQTGQEQEGSGEESERVILQSQENVDQMLADLGF